MNVLIVISCLCLLTVCSAGHKKKSKLSISATGTPCTPETSYLKTCGDRELLSEEVNVQSEEDGYGENVCRTNKTYTVQTVAYMDFDYCYGSNCKTYCLPTNNCTGPFVNEIELSRASCCDGFVEDSTASSFSRKGRRSGKSRSLNCTIMLRESVADCLLELNLELFTVQLLTESIEVAEELGDTESSDSYTVFAVTDASLELEGVEADSLLGHVVNGSFHGRVLPTLAEEVFLHVGKAEESVFVNGVEVTELNACQARNGMVHIVSSVIPQSSMTIAEQLSEDSRFSTFLRLLDGVNTTMFLDVADGKSRTVFAPTNDAFDELSPEGVVDCLEQPENAKFLQQLLFTHISAPAQYSATLSQESKLPTFNVRYHKRHSHRYHLSVQVEDGEIFLTGDSIPLEESDISANNGVIHAIPQVIVPSSLDFDELNNCAVLETGADM